MKIKIKDLRVKFLDYYQIKIGIRDEIERLNDERRKSRNNTTNDKKVS